MKATTETDREQLADQLYIRILRNNRQPLTIGGHKVSVRTVEYGSPPPNHFEGHLVEMVVIESKIRGHEVLYYITENGFNYQIQQNSTIVCGESKSLTRLLKAPKWIIMDLLEGKSGEGRTIEFWRVDGSKDSYMFRGSNEGNPLRNTEKVLIKATSPEEAEQVLQGIFPNARILQWEGCRA